MTWIELDYLVQKLKDRKFNWLAAPSLKYVEIRIDTRDDRAILLDRHGKTVATTKEQLDELFDSLNRRAELSGGILGRESA